MRGMLRNLPASARRQIANRDHMGFRHRLAKCTQRGPDVRHSRCRPPRARGPAQHIAGPSTQARCSGKFALPWSTDALAYTRGLRACGCCTTAARPRNRSILMSATRCARACPATWHFRSRAAVRAPRRLRLPTNAFGVSALWRGYNFPATRGGQRFALREHRATGEHQASDETHVSRHCPTSWLALFGGANFFHRHADHSHLYN